jgi:hypothetical protein
VKYPIPRIPADGRLAEVARAQPAGWFRDHVIRSVVGGVIVCGCALAEADPDCNVGHALFRLAAKETAKRT